MQHAKLVMLSELAQNDNQSAAEVTERVALLRIHVGRNAPTNPDCKKMLDEAEKAGGLFMDEKKSSFKITIQKIKSGIFEGKDEKDKLANVEINIKKILEGLAPVPESPRGGKSPRGGGDDVDDAAAQTKEVTIAADAAEIAVECGYLASRHNFDALAQQCVDLCKTGKVMGSPQFRIKLDYLKCSVLATELDAKKSITEDLVPGAEGGSKGGDKQKTVSKAKLIKPAKLDARHVDALKLSRRVEALKLLDRTLMSARRLGDPDLLQEGAM